ncbi:MAG: hypothetical protein A2Z18_08500 [Armatimonadetes bacterium RBG_16_58_9]|nr:MAG: hypothetical protein A2Z18_08500 [Armatimonadetes bacterium RBG_16_58_9]
MKRACRYLAAALLPAVALAAYSATPLVQQVLPDKDSVKGFGILEGSLQYGKGDDISKIYNGGYEIYTNNGVIDAARQMYMREKDYVEVTVHSMKSEKAALDFLKYWQKQYKVKSLAKTKTRSGFVVTKPSVMSHFVVGKYFTTVNAFYGEEKAAKDVAAFTTAVEKRILKLTKPPSSPKGK